MVKLVDTQRSGRCAFGYGGSSPPFRHHRPPKARYTLALGGYFFICQRSLLSSTMTYAICKKTQITFSRNWRVAFF